MKQKKPNERIARRLNPVEKREKLRAAAESPVVKPKRSCPLLKVHTSMSGKTLSHYQILDKIGEGTTGAVYQAKDMTLDRFVAIKVLRAGFIGDLKSRNRFNREARTAAGLNHPNIVTVHGIGEEDGIDYIVMEYVEGTTLDDLIASKTLRLENCLRIALHISKALARVHAAGHVHRDLKPANIKVTPEGQPKLLDFGLARESVASPLPECTTKPAPPITLDGAIVGTVGYMSPEQIRAERPDGRSDIFSLGAILYEMLSGSQAFQKPHAIETMNAILNEAPSDLPDNIPDHVVAIVQRCLNKSPIERIQTAQELSAELDQALALFLRTAKDHPPFASRRTTWAVGIAVPAAIAVLAAAIGLWSLRSHSPWRKSPVQSAVKTRHIQSTVPSPQLYTASPEPDKTNLRLPGVTNQRVDAPKASAPAPALLNRPGSEFHPYTASPVPKGPNMSGSEVTKEHENATATLTSPANLLDATNIDSYSNAASPEPKENASPPLGAALLNSEGTRGESLIFFGIPTGPDEAILTVINTFQRIETTVRPVNDKFYIGVERVILSNRRRLDPFVPDRVQRALFLLGFRTMHPDFYPGLLPLCNDFFNAANRLQREVLDLRGSVAVEAVRRKYNDVLDHALDTYPILKSKETIVFPLPVAGQVKITYEGSSHLPNSSLVMHFRQYSWGPTFSHLLFFDITSDLGIVLSKRSGKEDSLVGM